MYDMAENNWSYETETKDMLDNTKDDKNENVIRKLNLK
jgi:hypothetical protein